MNSTDKKTTLEMLAPYGVVKIELASDLPKRFRRKLLLSYYRRLKPILKEVRDSFVQHRDSKIEEYVRDELRGISEHTAPRWKTQAQKAGFRIRLRRLQFGLTQKQLASHAKLSRTHLNEIETGVHSVRNETMERIAAALKADIADFWPGSATRERR